MADNAADRNWVAQLRKGLVELLVLAALRRQEVYGYQLLQKLAVLNGLALTESTLYPVLGRLADDRLVAVRQVPSPTGPPRRYYRLTDSGGRRLAEMLAHWRQVNASIEALAGDGGARSDDPPRDSPARENNALQVAVPPVIGPAPAVPRFTQTTLSGDGV